MAFLLSCSVKTIPRNSHSSLSREGLAGRISSMEIMTFTFNPNQNKFIQDSCCATKILYNKQGNNIKSESSDIKGDLQNGIETDYYSNGMIREIRYFDKNRETTAKEEFFLDAAGKYIGGNGYDDGKLLRTFKIFEQNKYGQWTRLNWYSLNGNLYRSEEYKYDEYKKIGELWKEYQEDKEGKVKMNMSYFYNKKGEMISQEGIHPFLGQVKQNMDNRIYEYDMLGNWIQYAILDATGKITKIRKRIFTYR